MPRDSRGEWYPDPYYVRPDSGPFYAYTSQMTPFFSPTTQMMVPFRDGSSLEAMIQASIPPSRYIPIQDGSLLDCLPSGTFMDGPVIR